MAQPVEWLLEGPSWIQYRTRLDLLREPADAPTVLAARAAMSADDQVQSLLRELADWPGPCLTRHDDASHPLHKLAFVADLGLTVADQAMAQIAERILQRQSVEGAFQIIANIPPRFGGSGQDQLVWMLCDAPLILYSLVRIGLGENAQVQKAAAHLAGMAADNGWPCAVTPELGKFRGPGRKTDPCPYATLLAVRVLSLIPEWRDSPAVRTGAEALLGLWEQRKERRPYLFAMGRDFAKLKAPLIWYDILHVTDALTKLPWLQQDGRLQEMLAIVAGKADSQGRFTPESIWTAWKGWEFGQKRSPSRWLTLLAQSVLRTHSATDPSD